MKSSDIQAIARATAALLAPMLARQGDDLSTAQACAFMGWRNARTLRRHQQNGFPIGHLDESGRRFYPRAEVAAYRERARRARTAA